jgi:hypothetical protein
MSTGTIKEVLSRCSPSAVALWIVLAGLLFTMFSCHYWNQSKPDERGVIKWDVISYYAYLPATFIYGDVKLGFLDDPPEGFVNDNKFWPVELEGGHHLIQTSMGLSILYAPFFFTAHLLAPLFGQAPDGFSSIYQFFLVLSSLVYVMTGLVFLRKLLLRYFSHRTAAITVILIGLGTNLFYYTVHEGPMSHSYNFALIALLIYLVDGWYRNPTVRKAVFLGLLYGLITLIRPTNILTGVLFLLWGVSRFADLGERVRFIFSRYKLHLLILLFFIIPWIPQFVYWKAVTGSFLYNSYGPSGSSFFFGSPHIFDLLFSFRKGWYLYTPVMFAATLGIWFLASKYRGMAIPVIFYLIVEIYVLASWWSWWNGGSFGLRSFVDIYGVMALPLAALVQRGLETRLFTRIALLSGLFFLLLFNQYQTLLYTRGFIHHSGMTKEAYFLNFLRLKPDGRSWQMLALPDAQLARMGIYYEYYTGDDYAALKALDRENGLKLVRNEIEGDSKLMKEIGKYASRTSISSEAALNMVTERIYHEKINW